VVQPDGDLGDGAPGDAAVAPDGETVVECDPQAAPAPFPSSGKRDHLVYEEMPRCIPAGRNLLVYAVSRNLYEPAELEISAADRQPHFMGYSTVFGGVRYGWMIFSVPAGVITARLKGDGTDTVRATLDIPVITDFPPEQYLQNAGFEGGTWTGSNGSVLPAGWQPWHYPGTPDEIANFQYYEPHYSLQLSEPPDYSIRVRTQSRSVRIFNAYATHRGGLYQQVDTSGLNGCTATFSVWVNTWSHEPGASVQDCAPGCYRATVGLDPNGGTDGESADVIWGDDVWDAQTCPFWARAEVSGAVTGDTLTVFVRGWPQWPLAENPSYWDDAHLEIVCP
jgi:hypothetical protein